MDEVLAEFLTRFIVESDAIEGIENDAERVHARLLLDSPVGHVGALRMLHELATGQEFLDEQTVKRVQHLITEEQHLKGARKLPVDQRGAWREHDIVLAHSQDGIIRSHRQIGAQWGQIPECMADWIGRVRQWQGQYALTDHALSKTRFIAWAHWRYERIHPFADGNGRSGRALAYYLYRFADMSPFVFPNTGKQEHYYPCLQERTSDLMEQYFVHRSLVAR